MDTFSLFIIAVAVAFHVRCTAEQAISFVARWRVCFEKDHMEAMLWVSYVSGAMIPIHTNFFVAEYMLGFDGY